MTQRDLFPALPQNAVPDFAGQTIAERFEAFHEANPHVYSAIRTVALDLKRSGWKRAGMKQIFEHLRWRYSMQTQGEAWKLNNNYTAFYARLLMRREPELKDFFETRERVIH